MKKAASSSDLLKEDHAPLAEDLAAGIDPYFSPRPNPRNSKLDITDAHSFVNGTPPNRQRSSLTTFQADPTEPLQASTGYPWGPYGSPYHFLPAPPMPALPPGCRWVIETSHSSYPIPEGSDRRESMRANSPTGTARPTRMEYPMNDTARTLSYDADSPQRIPNTSYSPQNPNARRQGKPQVLERMDIHHSRIFELQAFQQESQTLMDYNGSPDTLDKFTNKCRRLAEKYRHLLGEEAVVDCIIAKLRGKARDAVDTGIARTDTVEDLVRDLKRKFGNVGRPKELRDQMCLLSQNRGESVTDYGARARKLLHRRLIAIRNMYPEHEKETHEKNARIEAKTFFLAGLHNPPEYRVTQLGPIDLEDAIDKAADLVLKMRPSGPTRLLRQYEAQHPQNAFTRCYRIHLDQALDNEVNSYITPVGYSCDEDPYEYGEEPVTVRIMPAVEVCAYCQGEGHTEFAFHKQCTKKSEFCSETRHEGRNCHHLLDTLKSGRLRVSLPSYKIGKTKAGQADRLPPATDVERWVSCYSSPQNRGIRSTLNYRKKSRMSQQPYTTKGNYYVRNREVNRGEDTNSLIEHDRKSNTASSINVDSSEMPIISSDSIKMDNFSPDSENSVDTPETKLHVEEEQKEAGKESLTVKSEEEIEEIFLPAAEQLFEDDSNQNRDFDDLKDVEEKAEIVNTFGKPKVEISARITKLKIVEANNEIKDKRENQKNSLETFNRNKGVVQAARYQYTTCRLPEPQNLAVIRDSPNLRPPRAPPWGNNFSTPL